MRLAWPLLLAGWALSWGSGQMRHEVHVMEPTHSLHSVCHGHFVWMYIEQALGAAGKKLTDSHSSSCRELRASSVIDAVWWGIHMGCVSSHPVTILRDPSTYIIDTNFPVIYTNTLVIQMTHYQLPMSQSKLGPQAISPSAQNEQSEGPPEVLPTGKISLPHSCFRTSFRWGL